MRFIGLFVIAALLGACDAQPEVTREQIAAVYVSCHAAENRATNHRADTERCAKPKFEALYAGDPNIDLMELYWATRAVVAEKLDAGKITQAEADLALAKARSQGASEWERRANDQAALILLSH